MQDPRGSGELRGNVEQCQDRQGRERLCADPRKALPTTGDLKMTDDTARLMTTWLPGHVKKDGYFLPKCTKSNGGAFKLCMESLGPCCYPDVYQALMTPNEAEVRSRTRVEDLDDPCHPCYANPWVQGRVEVGDLHKALVFNRTYGENEEPLLGVYFAGCENEAQTSRTLPKQAGHENEAHASSQQEQPHGELSQHPLGTQLLDRFVCSHHPCNCARYQQRQVNIEILHLVHKLGSIITPIIVFIKPKGVAVQPGDEAIGDWASDPHFFEIVATNYKHYKFYKDRDNENEMLKGENQMLKGENQMLMAQVAGLTQKLASASTHAPTSSQQLPPCQEPAIALDAAVGTQALTQRPARASTHACTSSEQLLSGQDPAMALNAPERAQTLSQATPSAEAKAEPLSHKQATEEPCQAVPSGKQQTVQEGPTPKIQGGRKAKENQAAAIHREQFDDTFIRSWLVEREMGRLTMGALKFSDLDTSTGRWEESYFEAVYRLWKQGENESCGGRKSGRGSVEEPDAERAYEARIGLGYNTEHHTICPYGSPELTAIVLAYLNSRFPADRHPFRSLVMKAVREAMVCVYNESTRKKKCWLAVMPTDVEDLFNRARILEELDEMADMPTCMDNLIDRTKCMEELELELEAAEDKAEEAYESESEVGYGAEKESEEAMEESEEAYGAEEESEEAYGAEEGSEEAMEESEAEEVYEAEEAEEESEEA
eukprot:gene19193-25810_t